VVAAVTGQLRVEGTAWHVLTKVASDTEVRASTPTLLRQTDED
jgi:hypothetical protein